MLLTFGIPSSVHTRAPFFRGKYLCRETYSVTFKWSNESKIGYWTEVKGKTYAPLEKVHDLEIEEDHSFLTSEYAVHNSAGGTILAYLEGITHVDPIDHDLSLDRFLTLDRIKSGKLPDIDEDLPSRDLLCGYETEVVEVEAEDGTRHILPEGFVIETDKGDLPIEQAIKDGAEVAKWW
jgi:hypothetical protein